MLTNLLAYLNDKILYIYVNKAKILPYLIVGYLLFWVADFICFNYLLKYALAMHRFENSSSISTFIPRDGKSEVVSCDKIQSFFSHVKKTESVVVRHNVGHVEIVGNNTTKQEIVQYSRVNQYTVSVEKQPLSVRLAVKVSNWVLPPKSVCVRMEGEIFTQGYLKKK
jgi:hypothetical protein